MRIHDHELEQRLGRDLHDQVDGMDVVPFAFDDVKGRAGRIRRNRRIAAGAGIAAALAVIVPGAMTAGGAMRSTDEIGPARSPEVTAREVRTTLTLEGLERGSAPAIEYFTPEGVVLPDGRTQPLPDNYQALVPGTGDGWIALGPAREEVVYLTEDFERDGFSPSGNGFVTTPDTDYVAWTMPVPGAQTIYLRSTSRPEDAMTWELPSRPLAEPVGLLGPDSVVYQSTTARGETKVGLARPDGSTVELPYVAARAADPVNGVIAVQTEVRDLGGCFGVAQAATQELSWETCDYALGSFSPDGAYVMATPVESDGAGPTTIVVLDAVTGDLVAEFASQGRRTVTLIRPAWEPAESPASIVATALQGDTTTMVRMSVDGTLEEVADPVATSDYGDLYYWVGQNRAGL